MRAHEVHLGCCADEVPQQPTLSQKQVGGLTLVLILGVCGYWFGGEPDTANDFSCSSWQTVIGTLRRSKNLDHATVIVGHGTVSPLACPAGIMSRGDN